MRKTQYIITDDKGDLRSGATLNVYFTGTTTNATLYSDNGVTTTPNPMTSDANGVCTFFVANGRYDLVKSGNGITTTTQTVPIFDPFDERMFEQGPSSFQAIDGSVAAPSYSFASQTTLGWYRDTVNSLTLAAGSVNQISLRPSNQTYVVNSGGFWGWSSSIDSTAGVDTALKRNAAGIVEINNGTAGTFRDLIGRSIASQASANPVATTTAVALNAAAGQPEIDFVDSTRTLNNRVAAIGFTTGQFYGRFTNDAYGAAATWLSVVGGQAAGVTSIIFGGTSATVFGVNGAAGQAQKTGFGTPTGGGVIANFPGATATLAQCSQAIAQLILDLKALGFYGA